MYELPREESSIIINKITTLLYSSPAGLIYSSSRLQLHWPGTQLWLNPLQIPNLKLEIDHIN